MPSPVAGHFKLQEERSSRLGSRSPRLDRERDARHSLCMAPSFVAVDLGASGGRVVLGTFGEDVFELEVLHRFANEPRVVDGHLRWNMRELRDGIEAGLAKLAGRRDVESIGVDTWGVDYGLLDARGRLIEEPVSYRDERTAGALAAVDAVVPLAELFRATGIQVQPFNTLVQLFAQRRAGEWPRDAARLLMMPDLIHRELCGASVGEVTIASTTQLLSAATRAWDAGLFERLDLPLDVMPPLVTPGTVLGRLEPELRARLGLPELRVVAPATHDTASAVAGTPLEEGWAYLSSGTWSLLGVETREPLLTGDAARANVTNEAGVEGTNRLLVNVMGLWILDSCSKVWAARGERVEHGELLARAERAPASGACIEPDDPRFFHPRDMVEEVRASLRDTGQHAPEDPGELARIVLESLAARYAQVLGTLERLTGRAVVGVRVVGGGAQNRFLNQATADATGREVVAGPIEATAAGNLAVQAIAAGRFGDLAAARRYLGRHLPGERYFPRDAERSARARERDARSRDAR